MIKNTFLKNTIAVLFFCCILTISFSPLVQVHQQKAEAAALNASKFLPGVAKAAASAALSCLVQVGVVWLLGKGTSQAERIESVPVATGAGNSQFASSAAKEYCLDAVATNLAKATLQKFTQSTVAWINSGFNGDPLYVRDPESFFNSIANAQLGSISLSIEKSGAPFARSLAQSLILSNLTDFNAAMKYNVDAYLGKERATQYNADFAVGGWDAWLLQTQFPQNNPVGASINVANEVNKQLAGTQKSVAQFAQDEIDQGSGFLGLKECVDPSDYTRGDGYTPPTYTDPFDGMTPEEFAALTMEERAEIENNAADSYIQYVAEQRDDYEKKHTCKRWETRTPGKAITDQLNITLGSSTRQAELADELNESISTIFDSLISHFLTKGLDSLSGEVGGNTTDYSSSGFGNYGSNSSGGGQYGTGSWANQTNQSSSMFSIWKDIDQLISWQNTYITTLEQEKNIYSTQLIPRLYELDFCVPGPRADWETTAQEEVTKFIPSLKDYYSTAPLFELVLGISIFGSNNVGILENGQGGQIVQSIFEQYRNYINIRWFSQQALLTLPTINTINNSEYKKISQYNDEIESVTTEILETKSVISRLEYIKQQIQGIPNPLTGGVLTQTQQDTVTQQQRILDQVSMMAATQDTIDATNDKLIGLQSDVAYVGDQTKGLIKQCIDEVNALPDPNKKIRFPYPTDKVPMAKQTQYTPGPVQTVYESGSGEQRDPTYLKPYMSYGTGPNCSPAPGSQFINIYGYVNLQDCDTTSKFETFIKIY